MTRTAIKLTRREQIRLLRGFRAQAWAIQAAEMYRRDKAQKGQGGAK